MQLRLQQHFLFNRTSEFYADRQGRLLPGDRFSCPHQGPTQSSCSSATPTRLTASVEQLRAGAVREVARSRLIEHDDNQTANDQLRPHCNASIFVGEVSVAAKRGDLPHPKGLAHPSVRCLRLSPTIHPHQTSVADQLSASVVLAIHCQHRKACGEDRQCCCGKSAHRQPQQRPIMCPIFINS